MQPSGLQHRKQAPALIKRAPKDSEITLFRTSQFGPEMIGSSLALGAGPLYTNAIMGQAPSAAEREHVRKASSAILREDCIQVVESDNLPNLEPYPKNDNYTYRSPYPTKTGEAMITQESLLRLPRDNLSRELAFFLRTTGPAGTWEERNGVEGPLRSKGTPKNALRFLNFRSKRTRKSKGMDRDQSPFEEGDLLSNVPQRFEQKVSTSGKRYFALKGPLPKDINDAEADATFCPNIVDSRVSISFSNSINPRTSPESCFYSLNLDNVRKRRQSPLRRSSTMQPVEQETRIGAVNHSLTPVRPAASYPPTPEPVSAVSMDQSFQSPFAESVKTSLDLARALSSNSDQPIASPNSSLPKAPVSNEESLVTEPDEVDIKHPSPRRLASHTILLQRAFSTESTEYRRSVSNSPGPPPPRSPLRPTQRPMPLESTCWSETPERITPKPVSSIKRVRGYNMTVEPIKPTVVTDCTGPIKRPRSAGKNTSQSVFQISRRERDERTRARRLRDRPMPNVPIPARTIDAMVNAPVPVPRQKLKKARPHIQIPSLRPAPLAARASSSASSNRSWKKVTEDTRTPISAVPSAATPTSNEAKTGYTPISPTASYESANAEEQMALSPVMLVAQEIPVPKARSPPQGAKVIVKPYTPRPTYTPRPRSASIPRSAMKRRSGQGAKTPTTADTPYRQQEQDEAPLLPSPPPNRALPPTPPASGSERRRRPKALEAMESRKELPVLPKYEITPKDTMVFKRGDATPHVISQAPRRSAIPKASADTSRIHARLEALERQNALLSAALTAVLRTNGALNGPLSNVAEIEALQNPTAWETRIARRSAASHVPSSSNGSASLDLYMNTRQGNNRAR